MLVLGQEIVLAALEIGRAVEQLMSALIIFGSTLLIFFRGGGAELVSILIIKVSEFYHSFSLQHQFSYSLLLFINHIEYLLNLIYK